MIEDDVDDIYRGEPRRHVLDPALSRKTKVFVVIGWLAFSAASWLVAKVAGWSSLTEGPRPAILYLAGLVYWCGGIVGVALVRMLRSLAGTKGNSA